MTTANKVPNRLAKEKSPYLLQHQYNPVDWYPWGEEAFAKAKAEDKPIFLSIGYSTCHWCHVMERESFEDEEFAAELNKGFVSIKVDREERPDIDHVYMTVCQALTGHGGWPLTVIMTADKKPFFAGTYFPKESRRGLPGLLEILRQVQEIWNTQRQKLLESGEEIILALSSGALRGNPGELPDDIAETTFDLLQRSFDRTYGGFGRAPKFPAPHNLTFLLRYGYVHGDKEALEIVERTLEGMYKGGIFDHVGFGFSRYSTDEKWLAPHFEKMLYDNALLALAYLETYQVTKKRLFREVAEMIFAYILRDMASPEGGFYSAEDADSEGEEGKFYVWTRPEVVEILGREEGEFFCGLYDIGERGNFEGKSIPNLIGRRLDEIGENERSRAEKCRETLFQARARRIRPYKDDKILTAWNALMIAALAVGARLLGDEKYLAAAQKAVGFICEKLWEHEGGLLARYRDGEAAYPAYLDDHAFLVWALLEMYETTYEPQYLKKAVALNGAMLENFWDEQQGGLYMTNKKAGELPARPKEIYDGALPSGNSVAALNLLRLAALTGDTIYEEKAGAIFAAFGGDVAEHPSAYCQLMQAYLYLQSPSREIIIVGKKGNGAAQEMIGVLREMFVPHSVSVYLSPEQEGLTEVVPFLADYRQIKAEAAAFICEDQACREPICDAEAFRAALGQPTQR